MFRVEFEQNRLALIGQLTETSTFPKLDFSQLSSVEVSLEKFEGINSAGVQTWTRWISGLPATTNFVFSKSRPFINYYFGSVDKMLPARCDLLSFYVPYFNPESNEIELLEFTRGVHFTESELRVPRKVSSVHQPYPNLELDATPSRYFYFLKAFFPKIVLGMLGS